MNGEVSLIFNLDLIGCLWVESWGGWVWAREKFKSSFSDQWILVGLRTQDLLVFKLDVLGDHLSSVCLKSWGAHMEFKPLTPQGELLGFSSLLVVGCYIRWDLWRDFVPASPPCFAVIFFLFVWCEVTTQPAYTFLFVFFFFKRKNFHVQKFLDCRLSMSVMCPGKKTIFRFSYFALEWIFHTTEIKWIIKDYYGQLSTNILDYLE